jgi:hypothetical protein
MDAGLKRMLGLLQDEKRIYHIIEDREVKREDFQFCQTLHQIVFGPRGFIETLGPTWNMIHDPRFMKMENGFIKHRRAIFGGNADIGRQFIFEDNTFTSSITDLEQYAEILGEGRNFYYTLTHPDPTCPIYKWLIRIYKGFTPIIPHANLECSCSEAKKQDPRTFKDASKDVIWGLIKHECPQRAFSNLNTPNAYGEMMFHLIKECDLIGLIADYAVTSLIDSYIYLETGEDVVEEKEFVVDPHGANTHKVLKEIDLLEQALTQRAVMRLTAAKVLDSMRFWGHVEKTASPDFDLTDMERDELLAIVYNSEWPENKPKLVADLLGFIVRCNQRSLEVRQQEQLEQLRTEAQETVTGLMRGTIQPINPRTEPVVEIPRDEQESDVLYYAALMEALQRNPWKQELFVIYTDAEAKGDRGIVDMLAPIFSDPDYLLDEIKYYNFLKAIAAGVLTDGERRNIRVGKEDKTAGTETTGIYEKDVVHYETGRFDYIGQRENPDKPGTWQVQLKDGTWHDTQFPDPPKQV